jgi:hypothetical protein
MNTYTLIHVLLSLVGILSGLVLLYGLLTAQRLPRWTHVFVWTTVATTLTGFGFPFNGFTPALGVGIVSTIILVCTVAALYVKKLAGAWRGIYVVTAVAALYLNVFVLIVQLFLKAPALHALAPQGKEPPFVIAQGITLLFFVAVGYLSLKRFHPHATSAPAAI